MEEPVRGWKGWGENCWNIGEIPVNKIIKLLKEGESEEVEFKPSLSQIDKIMESVSAFSNTKGGEH